METSWLSVLRYRLAFLFRRRRFEADLDEELSLHLEAQAEANRQAGMSPAEARDAALRQFGQVSGIKDAVRDRRSWNRLESTLKDLRYSIRTLLGSPVFSAIAVISLALGIGANTLVFSLLNGVLLRSLPVRNPSELRSIIWAGHDVSVSNYRGTGWGRTSAGAQASPSFPYSTYRDFRDNAAGFTELFAFSNPSSFTALASAGAARVQVRLVSGNFFAGYGASVLSGRPFSLQDDQPDASLTAVITYRCWQQQFGLNPDALGQPISLGGVSFTVVGILGPAFRGPTLGDTVDVYVPMSAQPVLEPGWPLESYHHWWVEIMGRLAPGADERQVQTRLEILFRRTVEAPGGKTKITNPHVLLEDGSRGPLMMRESFASTIYVLLGAVGLVLLVACANLASLVLARGASRSHEYAVRTALGAGRARLIRRALSESTLLALAGGSLGLVVAWSGKKLMLALLSSSMSDFHVDIDSDLRVLAFTFGLTLVTILLFGLLPALRTTRLHPLAALKERTGSGRTPRLGSTLVVAQVALSLVLLTGAGLFLRTLVNLRAIEPGFDIDNLLLFEISPGQVGYREARISRFYEELSGSVNGIPGVASVAFSNPALLSGAFTGTGIKIPGRPVLRSSLGQFIVSDRFFTAMGIPILLGRELDAGDTARSLRVIVVNQTFVKTYFPDENPLGKTVMSGSLEYTIVGVCRDSRFQSLRWPTRPAIYCPFRQSNPGSVVFAVRSRLASSSLAPAIRRAVAGLDREIPMTAVRTQTEQVDRLLVLERLFAGLCTAAGLLALLLSSIGLYGLIAYNVARRTSEIGIRMALGAKPGDVTWSVIRPALAMTIIGTALGLAAALGLGQLISNVLYGVRPYDSVILLGSAGALLGVATLAASVPARRAARTDPMMALRVE